MSLEFKLNEPHILKLLDTTPDLGIDGESWVYQTDRGALRIPQYAAAKLGTLFLQVGEEFSIGRYRQGNSPAEWVVALTARTEKQRAITEAEESERTARQNADATRRDLPGQLAASVREIPSRKPTQQTKGTGTDGPMPLQTPRIAAKSDRQGLPPRVSYRIALREITGTVTALLRESGEQWNDQAKQDLVSTAFISAAKAGVIAFDFDGGEVRS